MNGKGFRSRFAKCTGRYADELRIRYVDELTIVSEHRQVCTSGYFLGMFVFLNLEGRDPNLVIMLQGQLDSLVQIHGLRSRWIFWLRECTYFSCR